MLTFTLIIIGILCALVIHASIGGPNVIVSVYRQPGKWYWLKKAIFGVIFRLRQWKQNRHQGSSFENEAQRSPGVDSASKGYGQGHGYTYMESPQILSNADYAIDSTYFGATDKEGSHVVCRIARRRNRIAEVWLFLEIPGIGCLQLPQHPDTDVYHADPNSFRAGGLQFEILEPMKRWHVSFSGKLRKGLCNDTDNKPATMLETRFSFIWSAFSQPFNFDTDMGAAMLGDSIAREEWNGSFFERLKRNHQTHYEQWGELRGRMSVEGFDERQLHLQCVRDHSFGQRDWRDFYRYIIHFIYVETGMTIQVGIVSQPNLMSHVKVGYLSYANGDVVSVTDVCLNLWEIGEKEKAPPSSYTFSFQADGQTYTVDVKCGTTPIWYHHEDRGGKIFENFADFKVNGKSARGVAEFFYRNADGPLRPEQPPFYPSLTAPSDELVQKHVKDVVLPFTSTACQSTSLVGGKGAQLAQLSWLCAQQLVQAKVPKGICLSLSAFQEQLEDHLEIATAIQRVQKVAVSSLSDLPAECQNVVDEILSVEINKKLEKAVFDGLEHHVGIDYCRRHFAVRSSAAGEDGEEASSAGQMETLLGVVGPDQLKSAIQKCWASAFSHQAVEYRRQHGQPIRVLVGVVIQEMVVADSAGVLFTSDPITGSNSHLVINANFGLGESVVSGLSNPDTIRVERDPDWFYQQGEANDMSDGLTIADVTLGSKATRIVETGNGGVVSEQISDGEQTVCLEDDMILTLAKLGIELEKHYGSPRDIEWALKDKEFFLLQCRPITVADDDTEDDLLHEFDSPMTCDYQWMTTANISEMMPGALTPLSLSTFMRAIEYSLQMLNMHVGARQNATRLPKSLPAVCNHLFIALIDISTIFFSTLMVRKDTMEISLLGNVLPEFPVEDIQNYYGRTRSFFRRFLNLISMTRMWSKAKKLTSQWEKKIPHYTVGESSMNSTELFNCIDAQLVDYETVWVWTLINSGQSGNWATILMSILGGDASDWTSAHYGDMALLLSQCSDVYSAEVPHALESISKEISNVSPILTEEFLSTPDEDCISLVKGYPSVEEKVSSFLSRHGHRCLRESELREKSWRSAPHKFVSVIKTMLKTKPFDKAERKTVTPSELLAQMKTEISWFKRFLLKLLLPKAHAAVGQREWGKSISVQMSEIFKLAYNSLSHKLYLEGRLPDPDLMYFLTHMEIRQLLQGNASNLVIRSQKRRKVLAKQESKQFHKMNRSWPIPITSEQNSNDTQRTDSLKGMPVSQGRVKGTARVVLSLEEASVIQGGDILVVNSTDVGWSPYFPLLAGLVTELGGLISHGAVVAREYGIPCVVNVPEATSSLHSGDLIEIDGRLGLVNILSNKKDASTDE